MRDFKKMKGRRGEGDVRELFRWPTHGEKKTDIE